MSVSQVVVTNVKHYAKWYAIGLCVGVVYRLSAPIRRKALENAYSYLLSRGKNDEETDNALVRTTFRETLTPEVNQVDKSHTHPASAAWRSSCTIFGRLLANKLGLNPIVYQASMTDIRNGFDYSRSYHWAKDTMVPSRIEKPFSLGERDLTIIVDVDYYVDINELLMGANGPILLYTFQPKTASCSEGEFCFTFNKDNTVKYTVSGGAEYTHRVWNYGVDVVSVSCGICTKYFIIERRQANDHHEYVLLIPIGTWYWFYSILASYLSSTTIKHLEVVEGEFAVLDVQGPTGMMKSISKLQEYNCATVDVKTFSALGSVVLTSSGPKVGNATFQSWTDNDKHGSSVLVEFFRQPKYSTHTKSIVYTPADGVSKYQMLSDIGSYEPGCKPLMVPFMSPVYPHTFIPDRSLNNEKAAIKGRILDPQLDAQKMSKPPTKFLINAMDAFIKLLIPDCDAQKAKPHELEEVYTRQARPTQRSLLNQADADDANFVKRICKTFLKAEPYLKASDPRIISTYVTVDKREYSRYTYALTDYICQKQWYSFGKTPEEISRIVVAICESVNLGVIAADANRMDGHVFIILRELERMIHMRYFNPKYHAVVADLHSKQFKCKAVTTQGLKYNIEFQRGSGSPETALFNGLGTKFNDFLARVIAGNDYVTAYNALGQFGGDDALAIEISPNYIGGEFVVRAGKMIGQSIEVDEFVKGAPYVNYLSRFYTNEVWYGNPNSTCDMKRALAKLHVTPNLTKFSPLEKLTQKLSGLYRTDKYTPIIKQICQTAIRLKLPIASKGELDMQLASWWSQYDIDVNWPNEAPECTEALLNHWFLNNDVTALYKYLDDCKDATELLSMPSICEIVDVPEVKVPTVVNEQLFEPKTNTKIIAVKQPVPKATKCLTSNDICLKYVKRERCDKSCHKQHVAICNDFIIGKCQRKANKCKFAHIKIDV
jgi:hypothetical protein